jgi:N-acetylglucosamine-6-phosphate deacetylase
LARERHDLDGGLLVPGFIDTQVNGGGGVLFNDSTTVEAIAAIGAAHRPYGTTGFLPTLISDDLAVVDAAMRATEQAIEAGVPGVLGVHIEGPFLNVKRKGIHDSSKFRTLDDEAVALLSSLKRGKTLVTLAPETTTPEMVRRLTAAGVTVAAGHTNAAYGTVRKALDAGLTGFTHLFNAMSPLTSREPGVVGAALESITAWCGIIVDGRHVDPVRAAHRPAHPAAEPLHAGDRRHADGRHDRQELRPAGPPYPGGRRGLRRRPRHPGRLGPRHDRRGAQRHVDAGPVAGGRRVDRLGDPAAFLGLAGQRGAIQAGQAADLVLLDDDLQVRRTWIDGVCDS